MTICHCGKPLHYTDPDNQRFVEDLVERLGEFITVSAEDGRRFLVQRHYIALHGIRPAELAGLGFEELPGEL